MPATNKQETKQGKSRKPAMSECNKASKQANCNNVYN